MPLTYVPPNVRTCDWCGARTNIPKGLSNSEMKARLRAIGWEYRDFLVLCPRCAARRDRSGNGNPRSVRDRAKGIPLIGRLIP